METLVWIIHIIASLAVIGMVLLQHGKGADMGAAFGSGSSGSLFGASGSANFLSRATGVAVTVFFLTSMGLTYFTLSKQHAPLAVKEQSPAQKTQSPVLPQSQLAVPAGSKSKEIPN